MVKLPDPSRSEIHLSQYSLLREEVVSHVAETRRVEVYAVGGVAAVYAWLVTHGIELSAAWFIPVMFPLLGAIRSYALFKRVQLIAIYLRDLEVYWFGASSPHGWERFFEEKVRKTKETGSRVSFTAFLLWAALMVVTVIGPFIFAHGTPTTLK
jgi:hypothetical protein